MMVLVPFLLYDLWILISFLDDVDIQLISDFKKSFRKYNPVFEKIVHFRKYRPVLENAVQFKKIPSSFRKYVPSSFRKYRLVLENTDQFYKIPSSLKIFFCDALLLCTYTWSDGLNLKGSLFSLFVGEGT